MIPHSILYIVLLMVYLIHTVNSFYSLSFRCRTFIHSKSFCFYRCCSSDRKKRYVRFLTKCMHEIVHKALGNAFKPGRNDSEEDLKTVFYGFLATNYVVYVFTLIVLKMFLVLAIIFWDKFLFKVSYGCPYNVDVPNLILL